MSEDKPFQQLLALAKRSRQFETPLPAKENARTHWNGLGFSLLGSRLVVPMSEVDELMRAPQTTRLTGVKNFVVGVANVRGRLLVVLDVALFFGEASSFPKAQRRILAVEVDERYFGFMVDESLGMQHLPSEAFSESARDVDPRFAPFVKGCYVTGGAVWPVFSLARLAEDPSLETLAEVAA
jgi:twitching motility protein PilI